MFRFPPWLEEESKHLKTKLVNKCRLDCEKLLPTWIVTGDPECRGQLLIDYRFQNRQLTRFEEERSPDTYIVVIYSYYRHREVKWSYRAAKRKGGEDILQRDSTISDNFWAKKKQRELEVFSGNLGPFEGLSYPNGFLRVDCFGFTRFMAILI